MDIAFIPRGLIERFGSSSEKRIHINILLSHLIVIIIMYSTIVFSVNLSFIPHICLFQYLFGIPCPGCGIIRSLLALCSGDLHSAWIQNPVGLLVGVYLIAQLPFRMLAIRADGWSRRVLYFSKLASTGIVIALIANWIHRIT